MYRIFKIIILCLALSSKIIAQIPSNDPNFYLFWSDEFDFLDYTKWDTVLSNSWGATVPNDYNYSTTFRHDNIYVDEEVGVLHQIARKEDYNGFNYTRSQIHSFKEFKSNTYIEARIKLPNQIQRKEYKVIDGAFWTWGGGACSEKSWYNYREIDILEYVGEAERENLDGVWTGEYGASTGNIHYCDWDTCLSIGTPDSCRGGQIYKYMIPNQDQWHNYAVYWENKKVDHYLDDSWHHSFSIESPNNQWPGFADERKMIIINNVGINSRVLKNLYDAHNSVKHVFPYDYQTDWIRVWRLKKDCDKIVIDIPDFSNYDYALKKSITLGENTNVPITNDVLSLRAVDFIEFVEGFEVLDNREISFNTNACSK